MPALRGYLGQEVRTCAFDLHEEHGIFDSLCACGFWANSMLLLSFHLPDEPMGVGTCSSTSILDFPCM